ncbi:MAG: hypothetical protein QOH86_550 [Sphingomonadales bacterium]|nr:hypothetical protein [Sphingomonadales bacterium]
MPPVPRKILVLTTTLLAVALVAGCGGSDNGTGSRSRPAPAASEFPSAKGKTLRQVLLATHGTQGPVASPAAAAFHLGTNRFPFGVFTTGHDPITNAQVAVYAAPGRSVNGPAIGPFPARIEDLTTKPSFRAKTTAADPSAAQVAYVTDIPLDKPGPWAFAALIKNGSSYQYSLMPTPDPVGDYPMPQVGQQAPVVHTLTAGQVSNISQIDTRVPPDDMHSDDFANVVGKKPVVLLFATPALCQSRVCGPVTDIAAQVKQEFGDRVAFIHQEIYNNNNINDGPRPQMRAFHLSTEPWAYVIDKTGKVSTVLQGPFSVQELEAAVQKVAG